MAAQIMIELVPDVTKVKSALDTIEAGGDDTSSFKAGNAELEKRNKLLADQKTKIDANTDANKKQLGTINDVTKGVDKMATSVIKISGSEFNKMMRESGKSAEQLLAELGGVNVELDEFANKEKKAGDEAKKTAFTFDQLMASTASLKAERKQLGLAITQLILTGQKESEMYATLIARAGDLDDALADANAAIRRTGSDTRGLDNLMIGMRAVTAGFTVATGAMALFGEENEDVQKALLKVNAAMSVLNGLTEIQNILRDEYVKSLIASTTAHVKQNVQIAIENGLNSQSVVVRTAATAAQWLLNAAMSANPIGLVVTALAALVSGLVVFISWSNKAAEAQARFNALLDTSLIEDEIEFLNKRGEEHIAMLEAIGAKTETIEQARMLGLTRELRLRKEALDQATAAVAMNIDDEEDHKKAIEKKTEAEKAFGAVQHAIVMENFAQSKRRRETQEKDAADATKTAEELATKNKQLGEKADADAKERAAKANERRRADAQAAADLQVELAVKGTQVELDAQIAALEVARDLQLENVELTANQRLLIETQTENKIADMRRQFAEKEQAQRDKDAQDERDRREKSAKETAEMEAAIQDAKLGTLARAANDITKSDSERFAASQKLREQELSFIEDQQTQITASYLSGALSYEQYQTQMTDATEAEEQKRFEIEQANAERRLEINRAVFSAIMDTAQQLSDALFEIGAQRREAELNDELDKLEKQKDEALKTKNLTEAQREEIQKRYDKQAAALKTEAAKKERRAQTIQAGVNTALAITNAMATAPWPLSIIMAAAAAAAGIIQVARINAAPLPQYAKGGRNVPRGMAIVGEEGPELIEMKGGENVYTARETDAILKSFKSSESRRDAAWTSYNGVGEYIDYEEIGRQVAAHMPEITTVNMVADEDGLSIFLQRQQSRTLIRNRRYSTAST